MARALGDTVAVMDDGRVVTAARWPRHWPRTKRCSSACWACRWERTNDDSRP